MEEYMSHILVITFEDENQGPAVLRSLKSLEHQGQLRIEGQGTAGVELRDQMIEATGGAPDKVLDARGSGTLIPRDGLSRP